MRGVWSDGERGTTLLPFVLNILLHWASLLQGKMTKEGEALQAACVGISDGMPSGLGHNG